MTPTPVGLEEGTEAGSAAKSRPDFEFEIGRGGYNDRNGVGTDGPFFLPSERPAKGGRDPLS